MSLRVLFVLCLAAMAAAAVAQSTPVRHADEWNSPGLQSTQLLDHPQAATLDLANAVVYGSGGYAQWVTVADVNGDGKPDLIVADGCSSLGSSCPQQGTVSVLLGNGDGTFQAAATYNSGGILPEAVAVADVNHDGKPDLLVGNLCGNTRECDQGIVGVLLGNGDGTFQAVVTYSTVGYGVLSLTVADVNGDGKPDVIASNLQTSTGPEGQVAVLLGNGDGTFQPAVTYDSGGTEAISVAVADVNGDNKLDLVVSNECGSNDECGAVDGTVGVLFGNGDGTFQPATAYSSGGLYSGSVAVADLNGDGKPDLLVTNGCHSFNCSSSGTVAVLLGAGQGTFESAALYPTGGTNSGFLAVKDVNGDGKLDVVVNNPCGESLCQDGGIVSVLLGNSNGTLQPPQTYDSGGFEAFGVAVADLNGDGRADIVVANNCNILSFDVNFCVGGNSGVGVLLGVLPGTKISTTSVASSISPWTFGQTPITLTATVVPPSGGTATGSVEFYDGWVALGSGTLSGNVATLGGFDPAIGYHMITARYGGGGSVPPSTSTALPVTSNLAPTTTSLISSVNPSYVNQSVTFTATVTGQYRGPVTGTMAFVQGRVTLAIVTLVNGEASFSTVFTTKGTRKLVANYSGDANNVPSGSSTLKQVVDALPAATTTSLTTSGSPSIAGQPVTFTATVSSTYGTIPNGEIVTFTLGTSTLGSAPISNGIAALTTSALKAGTHIIKATYPGDGTFKSSFGRVTQVVDK